MKRGRDGFETAAAVAKGIGAVCLAVFSYYLLQFVAGLILQRAGASLSNAAFRIVYTSVWVVLALLSSLLFRKNLWTDHRILIRKSRQQAVLLPFSCLMAFLLGLTLNCLVGAAIEWLPVPEAWIEANYESVSGAANGSTAAVFAALYVAAPLTEELVFRGKGYRILEENCGGVAAALITSLVFAAAHGNILQGIYAFTAGMLFSLIIARAGSLLTGIAAHMGFNLSNALLASLLGGVSPVAVSLGCLAVFAVSLTAILVAGGMIGEPEETEAEETEAEGPEAEKKA